MGPTLWMMVAVVFELLFVLQVNLCLTMHIHLRDALLSWSVTSMSRPNPKAVSSSVCSGVCLSEESLFQAPSKLAPPSRVLLAICRDKLGVLGKRLLRIPPLWQAGTGKMAQRWTPAAIQHRLQKRLEGSNIYTTSGKPWLQNEQPGGKQYTKDTPALKGHLPSSSLKPGDEKPPTRLAGHLLSSSASCARRTAIPSLALPGIPDAISNNDWQPECISIVSWDWRMPTCWDVKNA